MRSDQCLGEAFDQLLPTDSKQEANRGLVRAIRTALSKRRTLGRHGGGVRGRLAPSGGAVLRLDMSVRQRSYHLQGSLPFESYNTRSFKRTHCHERIAAVRLSVGATDWRHATTKRASCPVSSI